MARIAKSYFKVEMVYLKVLDGHDCYGYQMTQIIKKITNGAMDISEGTMYPILYKLEDAGYISSKKVLVGKRMQRVYYHLEDEGRKHLQALISEYEAFTKGISNILGGIDDETYE